MVDVNVVLANRVYVEQERLTSAVRCRLIGLASFSNPEFYSRQRLKYSVYGQPRVISRALNGERFLQVPRGCLESVLKALKAERFNPVLTDRRYAGVPLDATFRGELRPGQKLAVSELRKSDTLFLALPVSWKGRLTQFAGRLHRLRDGKREVRIYDYVDLNVDVCSRMYDRRAKAYAAIGYRLVVPVGMKDGWPTTVALPAVPHWQETFADSVRRLCRDGLDEALADLFVRATLLVNLGPHGVGHADAAQAARAFLFARLESYAATKGLFRENVRVPIPCGTNPFLEVDLLAEKGRLAIRLDAMADVADVEAYRRARREDALLQRKGYRIVRFFAEDVCTRLDATLDSLLAWMPNRAS